MAELNNVRVAVIATDGVEQSEIREPIEALKEAGARVDVITPNGAPIQAFQHMDKGDKIQADRNLSEVKAAEYDGVMLPGGAINADHLRVLPEHKRFLREMAQDNKPFAVICHAPWELISAGLTKGRRMTSYHTIEDDLRNAGVNWVDEEVCVDGNLVTSRSPKDLPAFNREMVRLFSRAPVAA